MIYHSEYIRICKDCAASFRTDRPKKQYCPDCAARRYKESVKKYNQSCKAPKYQKPKASKKKYKKPALSIAQVCRIQKLYNENNKTFLSYGDIVRKIESSEIEVTVTNGVISYVPKD